MDALLEELGEKLKKLREQKKLSQSELAERIAMPQSHLSKIESGRVNLSVQSLFQIVRALEHELLFVPRQDIRSIQAILDARETPENARPGPAYSPDEEN